MFDFVKNLRKQWLHQRGRRYAQWIFREWEETYLSDEEMRLLIKEGPLAKRTMFNDPFGIGFDVQWQEFGANDASAGRIRAKKFQLHSYNLGWTNLMLSRHKTGWIHPIMDKALEDMQRLYWDKIRVGQSEGYYSD